MQSEPSVFSVYVCLSMLVEQVDCDVRGKNGEANKSLRAYVTALRGCGEPVAQRVPTLAST